MNLDPEDLGVVLPGGNEGIRCSWRPRPFTSLPRSLVRIFPPKARTLYSRSVVCQFCGVLVRVWLRLLEAQAASGDPGPEFECRVHVSYGLNLG